MEMPEIECNKCGWQGFATDLHCSEEDHKSGKPTDEIPFNLCPDCGSKDIVDYED